MTDQVKYLLDESELPTHWYNIVADLPERPPRPLHPRTHQPMTAREMTSLSAIGLLEQDGSTQRYLEIPSVVRDIYRLWRPTPLFRARALERMLDTPARIYYKYEGVSPTGSHKVNTAVPQVFYNKAAGIERLTTETGAGQWGAALAFACAQFGVGCEVWWTGSSYDQKPYRKVLMEAFGATVHRSPSAVTETGRRAQADGNTRGSIGLAVSEAVEVALADPAVGYALGSTAGHVLLHQTVIGEEALKQFALVDDYPDVLISCVGGGSSMGGLAFPFLREKLTGGRDIRALAVEPTACPALTRGRYAWDHGDSQGLTPLMKMYTVGHAFVPEAIHAGGLRYHGMSPLISYAYHTGLIEAVAKSQRECFTAGVRFAAAEGILPAPESNHAVAACLDEAERCRETGTAKTILLLVTGHAHFDLSAYQSFRDGTLTDAELPDERLRTFLDQLPAVSA
ncbi:MULTISPECIES: TrpB-like pyridoxal phosphate-dependent enzyme [unclassified Nocardia]|uniref:TrpB-like pyridoxal phosphate-dependent enzyme n=1 Tax=unclassified Nocardia TaxID=2637762 RepID=UPI001CE3E251|nr:MULTISPECIES: TrpB-like pyridoxal phosphate-dependent enzyme [unclassified Nocardia]